jgi:tetratricopeptide (TPR) repeat protein
MNMGRSTRVGALATLLLLAGCAGSPGSIYVPVGGGTGSTSEPPPPPRLPPASPEPETPAPVQVPERAPSPSYRESGDTLSPAALSLVREADRLLAQGRVAEAITRLERAQRIAPRSAEVYFKLSEAYVQANQLARAEQFTLKGLSLAGNNTRLQRAGWLLLADIRRARGNVAGADQAEARAAAL